MREQCERIANAFLYSFLVKNEGKNSQNGICDLRAHISPTIDFCSYPYNLSEKIKKSIFGCLGV